MGVLRDCFYLELNADVQRILYQSVRAHRYNESQIDVETLADDMKACLLTAVDQALHRHKHTTSHGRLPLELWYIIWRQLPILDRIVLARVCKEWRTALSSATVWQHFDVSGPVLYRYPDWRKLFAKLLERSEPLPLYLRLEQRDPSQPYGLAYRLFDLVKPHLHRVVELRIKAQQHDFVPRFFGHFEALPALRSLVVEDAPPVQKVWWLVTPISLPALEYLAVYRGYLWVHMSSSKPPPAPVFPSITRLSLGIRLVNQLEEALEACPRLKTLDVYVVDEDVKSDDALLSVSARRILAQLDDMHVHLSTSLFVDWLARALDGANPRKLTVDVRDSQAKKSSFAFSILVGLGAPHQIACLHQDGRLWVTTRDAADRRTRCITFTMDACERIISQLAAALTDSRDVLELDSVTSKLARAVHWAVKVHTPEGVDLGSQIVETGDRDSRSSKQLI